jgi:hypothetical protein
MVSEFYSTFRVFRGRARFRSWQMGKSRALNIFGRGLPHPQHERIGWVPTAPIGIRRSLPWIHLQSNDAGRTISATSTTSARYLSYDGRLLMPCNPGLVVFSSKFKTRTISTTVRFHPDGCPSRRRVYSSRMENSICVSDAIPCVPSPKLDDYSHSKLIR